MADNYKPIMGQGERGYQTMGYKGSRAGERFPTAAEMEEKKDREEFDKSKGWTGIAGAARKPPKTEYERQLAEYRRQKAKAKGQAKALDK